MFHMEHCVFCAVLSPGTNKTNCGRPCDVHEVKLRDRLSMEHPLIADVGCRNTLFNAVPQSGAEIVPELLSRGVRRFRVELLEDRGPALERIARALSPPARRPCDAAKKSGCASKPPTASALPAARSKNAGIPWRSSSFAWHVA